MACRLFGTKPLPEPMLAYCQLDFLFSENRIGILPFSFKKMLLKLSSANVVAILSRGRWVKLVSTKLPWWIMQCVYYCTVCNCIVGVCLIPCARWLNVWWMYMLFGGMLVSFQAYYETSLLCIPIIYLVFYVIIWLLWLHGLVRGRRGPDAVRLSCSDPLIRFYLKLCCTFMTINIFWFWYDECMLLGDMLGSCLRPGS